MKQLILMILTTAALLAGCASTECRQIKEFMFADQACSTGYSVPYASGRPTCLEQDALTEIQNHCPNF